MPGPYSNVVYTEREAINAVWVLVSTAMIFFMQAGFALLECGSVRAKNSTSILIKNLFDACVGSIAFWLVGYSFAFGDVKNFIGGSPDFFASSGFENVPEDHYLLWIFHFAFASTSATIVSGSLAERTQLNTYIMFSFLQTGFIYPVVAAWTWGGGWLQQRGFHDFAGVTTIHLVGGCAGFCGAAILGERYGKEKDREAKRQNGDIRRESINFEQSHHYQKVINHVNKDYHQAFKEWLVNQSDEFRPHNQTFVVTGTLILWVAWLFFNGGSTNNLFVPRANGPAKIIMNTVISGSCGGVVAVFVKARVLGTYSFVNRYDCGALCNGALIGLVSVTGCCDRVEPWAAFIIGGIGALFYVAGCKILDVLHVDDPVEAAPVHFFGGVWGTLATGFFDNQNGLFYNSPNKGQYFGYQVLGIVAVIAWVGITSSIFFYSMKRLGLFRIDKAIEIIGLDIAEMGGVGEDIYEKMRREFGGSIHNSPRHSPRQFASSIGKGPMNNVNDSERKLSLDQRTS